jgi:GNAT superfamily N-acetyltransferase
MIRLAQVQDAELIAVCHRESVLSIRSAFYSAEQISAWSSSATPNKYLEAIKEGAIYVVEISGQIVTFGWLAPAKIIALYVAAGAQVRGMGSRMLQVLEEKLRAGGATGISLCASLNAQQFYENRGYVAFESGFYEMRGVSVPWKSMAKEISESGRKI